MGNQVAASEGLNVEAGQVIKFHLPVGFTGQVEIKDRLVERVFGTIHVWAPGTRKNNGKDGAAEIDYEVLNRRNGKLVGGGLFSGSHKWISHPDGRKPRIGYTHIPGDE
jgi:hypothetical protein